MWALSQLICWLTRARAISVYLAEGIYLADDGDGYEMSIIAHRAAGPVLDTPPSCRERSLLAQAEPDREESGSLCVASLRCVTLGQSAVELSTITFAGWLTCNGQPLHYTSNDNNNINNNNSVDDTNTGAGTTTNEQKHTLGCDDFCREYTLSSPRMDDRDQDERREASKERLLCYITRPLYYYVQS